MSQTQANNRTLPYANEPEVIAVTASSVTHTVWGTYGGKIAEADLGRWYTIYPDGTTVYAVWGQPTLGSVTGAGTSPPTGTIVGTPTFAGTLRVDVQATDGTLAGTTFEITVQGTSLGTSFAASGTTLTLASTGLTMTFGAGTFNADNYWTASSTLTADESATSGATVPMVFSQQEDYKLPEMRDGTKCLAVAVKGTGTGNLRLWPTSGK